MPVSSSILADLLKLSNPDMSTGTQGTVINTDLSGMGFPTSSYFNSSNMGTATNSMSNWGSLVDPTKSASNGSWKDWFGGTSLDGTVKPNIAGTAIGAVGGLLQGLMSYGAYKDTKRMNEFNMGMARESMDISKKTLNANLDAQYRARMAANPNGSYKLTQV